MASNLRSDTDLCSLENQLIIFLMIFKHDQLLIITQVGGYVVKYKGVTFVTVRGAGHLVPSWQPARALTLIFSFLYGSLPPASPWKGY